MMVVGGGIVILQQRGMVPPEASTLFLWVLMSLGACGVSVFVLYLMLKIAQKLIKRRRPKGGR